uniref:Uncharacterized protein n=1 Tax=Arundo donax TaxID=35708 RepID=A0A0A8YMV6_ARUDO
MPSASPSRREPDSGAPALGNNRLVNRLGGFVKSDWITRSQSICSCSYTDRPSCLPLPQESSTLVKLDRKIEIQQFAPFIWN